MSEASRTEWDDADDSSTPSRFEDEAPEVAERAVAQAARLYAAAEHENRRHRFDLAVNRAACWNS